MEFLGLVLMGGLLLSALAGALFSLLACFVLVILGLGFATSAWKNLSILPQKRLGRALLLTSVACLAAMTFLAIIGLLARSTLAAALSHLLT